MTLRKRWGRLLAGLAAAALTGCGSSDTASLIIDGPETALTLERIKAYVWTGQWEVQLVVRRFPDCQRRHNLAPAATDGFKVELFSPAPGAFIIRQGKQWYVTDLKNCDLQAFKAPPPEPGTPVGSFIEKDGVLRFERASRNAPAPASPAIAPGPTNSQGASY